MIKIPKFQETEGDCGQTVKYGTGKGTFTVVKKLWGRIFLKIVGIWCDFLPLNCGTVALI